MAYSGPQGSLSGTAEQHWVSIGGCTSQGDRRARLVGLPGIASVNGQQILQAQEKGAGVRPASEWLLADAGMGHPCPTGPARSTSKLKRRLQRRRSGEIFSSILRTARFALTSIANTVGPWFKS